jgi:putative sterol carrier protein
VHYIGGIFEKAFEDPGIGAKLQATGITLLVKSTNPDSQFTLDMTNKKVIPGDTDLEPSATMTMSADMQNAYWQGKVNLPFAMARGQVKVQGNVAQLLKLAPLSKSLYPVYVDQLKADGRDDLIVIK